jgi:hypothetical protein
MPDPNVTNHTAQVREACGTALVDALNETAQAVAQHRWRRAGCHARLLRERAELLYLAIARDALDAGVDWWQLGTDLSMHPQDVWELYQCAVEGLRSPAEQRPDLAVQLTAGVDALHDYDTTYGADLDDLPTSHSLHRDPTVLRLREASVLLRADIWVAVNLPGEADPRSGRDWVAIAWSSVASNANEIGHIRQALAVSQKPTHCRDSTSSVRAVHDLR